MADLLLSAIRDRVDETPDHTVFRFTARGDLKTAEPLTYGALDTRARALGARLQDLGLDAQPVLLLFPPGLDYICALFGCLYAGAIAVPAYPPDPSRLDRTLPRLQRVAADCRAPVVLTTRAIRDMAGALASLDGAMGEVQWLAIEDVDLADATAWEDPEVDADELGLLQYTSGSTGDPRGVCISHGNLAHNVAAIASLCGHARGSTAVMWLPMFHDLGLIGGVVHPVVTGMDVTLLSPMGFLRDPLCWLDLMHQTRAETSGGPDFGYRLVLQRLRDRPVQERWDLSDWKIAFVGAEPVQAATLERFSERLRPAGFRGSAFMPCFGLAESTLLVNAVGRDATWSTLDMPAADPASTRSVVSNGPARSGRVEIVDPRTGELRPEGTVGEVWVQSPSVAKGYWGRPEETARTFGARLASDPGAGTWLRTGDLGAIRDGELLFAGRMKDLVIVRGRNLYPQDVEAAAAQSSELVYDGRVVAFGLDEQGEEQLVVAAETRIDGGDVAAVDALRQRIAEAVAHECGVRPYLLLLVRRGGLPTTSSGKLQRRAAREAYVASTLPLIAELKAEPVRATERTVSARLRSMVAAQLGVRSDAVPLDRSFRDLGLDSADLVQLAGRLEQAFGRRIPTLELFAAATVASLAELVADAAGDEVEAVVDARPPYTDELATLRERIDRRKTTYQFDLDEDIAWDRIDAPGDFVPQAMLEDLGFDTDALAAHPEAARLLQWALAVSICDTFELLELYILVFVRQEAAGLGDSRSIDLLYAEEEKHIALFRRIGAQLQARRPELALRLRELSRSSHAALKGALSESGLAEDTDPGALHYQFWLRTLFFEDFTLYLDARLREAGDAMQPTWSSVHLAHAREELQHVATDLQHLAATTLTEDEQTAVSARVARHMVRSFDHQFGLEAPCRLVEEQFPEVRLLVPDGDRRAASLRRMLRHKEFVRTRRKGPFFEVLRHLDPALALSCADLVLADGASEPLAIVGAGCRFPGGVTNLDALWSVLATGTDTIGEIPRSRFDVDEWFDPDPGTPGRSYTRWAGTLDGIEGFDASFFGIAPKEARAMDPQQRLLLETAWEAMESAARRPDQLHADRTGVFIGVGSVDYSRRNTYDAIDPYTLTGNSLSVTAGRISYLLGLQGPAMAVDTACSSSLVALHLAVGSMRRGECDAALVGAVNLILSAEVMASFSQLRVMSPVGRCKTFDASADGYVRSEGCATILIRRLSDAVRDGDPIVAVLRGSAVNQDGRSNGLTAPSSQAQAAVIRAALDDAGLSPTDVDYVEAHGTGTLLGDPIEVAALGTVMAGRTRPLVLGAVKTNLGHGETVAGMSGLLKAALVLQEQTVPPHLHLQEPNPQVDWQAHPFEIPTTLRPLDARYVGVSAFGFSGTNAHVVLERAPEPPALTAAPRAIHVLPLSARSDDALVALAHALADHLESRPDLPLQHVALTLATGRVRFRHRLAVVAGDRDEAIAGLRAVGSPGADVVRGLASERPPTLAFAFTGQGSQGRAMARDLSALSPAFGATLQRLDRDLDGHALSDLLTRDDPAIDQTRWTQPGLVGLQLGLAALWRAWGVLPDVVLGHSVGEIAAAAVAGVVDAERAMALVDARASLMQALPAGGAMIAAQTSEAAVEDLLRGQDDLSLAAVNSADAVVLSGGEAAVRRAEVALLARGVPVQRLVVSHAFHSGRMAPMLADFARAIEGIAFGAPKLPFVSALAGDLVGREIAGPAYWVEHVRAPVRFDAALQGAVAAGAELFLELGPHHTLTALAARAFPELPRVPSLRRGTPGPRSLARAVAGLFVAGVELAPAAFCEPASARRVALPTCRFQRQRLWKELAPTGGALGRELHPLLGLRADSPGRDVFEALVAPDRPAWLADHQVGGRVVVPATAFMELACAAARSLHGAARPIADLVIERPLVVDAQLEVQVIREGDGELSVWSRQRAADGHRWVRHATARIGAVEDGELAGDPLPADPGRAVDIEEVYRGLAAAGLPYGPCFRALRRIVVAGATATGRVALPAVEGAGEDPRMERHPALLDAMLQGCAVLLREARVDGVYLPAGVDHLALRPGTGPLDFTATLIETGATCVVDLRAFDEAGQQVVRMDGVRLQRAHVARAPSEITWTVRWDGAEAVAGEAARGTVVGEGTDAPALAASLPEDAGHVVFIADAEPDEDVLSAAVEQARTCARDGRTLTLVTRGAVAVGSADKVRRTPGSAAWSGALWGLGRTLQQEVPALRCRLVDLDPAEDGLGDLIAELGRSDEPQVALRGEHRLVARLARHPGPSELALPSVPGFVLRQERPGLDGLALRAQDAPEPGPGEVLVEVLAAGLNFRDVLNTLGMIPGPKLPLGGECAGRVVAVGEGVDRVEVGDRVVALGASAFGRWMLTDQRLVARMPAGLTVPEAATLPIAVMTAWYGLVDLAGVRAGQRVLIHAATGGVGQAAVALARQLGAEVLGTASRAKWDVAHRIGVSRVFDSRDPEAFRAAIADEPPVDVVLNSLTGAFIADSMRLLVPGGHFLELGKAELLDAAQVAAIREDVRYQPFDLATMDPDLLCPLLDAVVQAAEERRIRPLASEVWPIQRAPSAFRGMSQGRHLGKIVLDTGDLAFEADPGGVYLVTGGFGALGQQTARWLVARGARRLVLSSRSARADHPLVAELAGSGVEVHAIAADLAREEEVVRLCREAMASGPLRGVFHVAGLLDDALLDSHDEARVRAVVDPKLGAALALHRETLDAPLHAFVLFSSVAALLGSPGQAAYSAANAGLDALAEARREQGLPALAVQWGPWAGEGMAARLGANGKARYAGMGLGFVEPEAAFSALGRALVGEVAVQAVMPLDLGTLGRRLRGAAAPPFFADLVHASAGDRPAPGAGLDLDLDALGDLPPAEQRTRLLDALRTATARVLGVGSAADVDPGRPLRDLGLDSLMAVDLLNALAHATGRDLPPTLLYNYSTLDALVGYLLDGEDGAQAEPEPAGDLPADEALAAELAALESLL